MKKVQKIRAVVQYCLEAYGLLDAEVAASVAERYTAMLMDGREGDAKAFLDDFVSDAHYRDIIVNDARSAHKRSVAEIRGMVEGLPAMMAASRAHAEAVVVAPAVEEPAAVEVVPVQAAPVAGIDAVVAAAEAEGIPASVIRAGRMFYRRKNRLEHVPGDFDKAGRFYADEQTPSVRQARSPSKAWPYSQMNAARTAAHCASACGVADEHLLIVKRIALAAERGDAVDAARKFVGQPWRTFVREEARLLRQQAEREQAEAFRALDACHLARLPARVNAHAIAAE